MPMETLDVAIIATLPIDGLICTDAEFERWARLRAGQDEFPWQSKLYRPDTTSTWLGCRVSEPTHLSVVMINWSEQTAEIGISVAIIPG
ncbi:MAG: hypothetical protein H0X25_16625 [Acidobacteriales bacterium]|nr:hypothetical protein [Terriglobales bacterium]